MRISWYCPFKNPAIVSLHFIKLFSRRMFDTFYLWAKPFMLSHAFLISTYVVTARLKRLGIFYFDDTWEKVETKICLIAEYGRLPKKPKI